MAAHWLQCRQDSIFRISSCHFSDSHPAAGARLMVGLGGSLDVFAGVVERAPEGFQKLGLEWLYRLMKEPRRIGRMARLPLVLFQAAGARLTGGRARA